MEKVRIGSLSYSVSPGIGVPHCFTTRLGGKSEGYLSSMNIGTHRGDSPENVVKNYEILGSALGFDPHNLVLTHQTHTTTVLAVGGSHKGAGLFAPELPECDGLITCTPGLALVCFTADCTPILLWDKVTGAVGAVHAGWRGTAGNIAGIAVKAMEKACGCRPENICAAIGPNIGSCCFETDADVPEALLSRYGQEIAPFIRQEGEKFFPDLKKINAFALKEAGLSAIDISGDCTVCHPDLYWSHRAVGSSRGSQGALILCQGESL